VPTLIVLAMHGAPPNDFPGGELAEYFRLHSAVESAQHSGPHQGNVNNGNGNGKAGLSSEDLIRYRGLEARIRSWPRTATNDPFPRNS
jgi:sirohydrochlorin cobaltochelatase